MQHGVLVVATATGTGTASLTAVTPEANHSLTVLDGYGQATLNAVIGGGEASTAARELALRVRSPNLHDSALAYEAQLCPALLTAGRQGFHLLSPEQILVPANTLTVEGIGGSAAGESSSYVLCFKFARPQINMAPMGGTADIIGREVSTAGGAIDTPAWSAYVGITAGQLKAKTDYAVLGVNTASTTSGYARFSSPQFSGLEPAAPLQFPIANGAQISADVCNTWFTDYVNDVPVFRTESGVQVQTSNLGAAATGIVFIIMSTKHTG